MSDAEWDKEDYEPPALIKPAVVDRWDGEDEDDVKESWDDDDPKENKNEDGTDSVKASQPKKKKPLAQIIAEKEEKQRRDQEERKLRAQEASRVISPEELHEEKLRRQRMQEESDLQLAKEAFGITDIPSGTGIDSMNPSTKEEFEEFRKALVTKILQFEKSPSFVPFLDDIFRELSVNLDSEDIKKLSSTLTAVANEKSKLKQVPKNKKKTKKAGLNVGKGSNDLNDIGETFGTEYDDFI